MNTFLQIVANDIYHRIGEDLSHTAVIFPGKRASLFLNQQLVQVAGHPLWSPAYLTISELFAELSPLTLESPIRQVCLLYEIYKKHTHRQESLDDFYAWGELMLSDFDDIDKNLVDAKKLFVNLSDDKEIEQHFQGIPKDQIETLQKFFNRLHTEEESSDLKQNFIHLWEVMNDIYTDYRTQLQANGHAYEGMLYRDVIEHFNTNDLRYDHYVIVGFNVLNRVERALFRQLKASGKALFYWDYDQYYSKNTEHEAGIFIRENIEEFGNALPDDPSIYDHLSHLPQLTTISAASDNAQARYLHDWLQHNLTANEQETAVVLCDEEIALPVLHAFPTRDEQADATLHAVENVNITMGFKFTQTPVYSFICALLDLQIRGYNAKDCTFRHDLVNAVLNHPYIQQLFANEEEVILHLRNDNRLYLPLSFLTAHDGIAPLFTPQTTNTELLIWIGRWVDKVAILFRRMRAQAYAAQKRGDIPLADEGQSFTQLYEEALFRAHQIIGNFQEITADGTLAIRPDTLVRLIQRVLSQTSIPFHGEPIMGLQVMGVLETRNLDFKHIILLSVNEGKLPKADNEASFIPYNLREAFGMTTLQRRNAVYAYYFYRMIQRAEQVTLVYNDGTNGLDKQEPSRFIMQLQVEFPGTINALSLTAKTKEKAVTAVPFSSTTTPTSEDDMLPPSLQKRLHEEQMETDITDGNIVSIEQTPETLRKLQEHFRYSPDKKKNAIHRLSASALNDYLDCPLKFYLQHIEGLNPPREVNEDIDQPTFGTLFHYTAELTYKMLQRQGDVIDSYDIDALLNEKGHPTLEGIVDRAFREKFFNIPESEVLSYNGTQLIVRHVILRYMLQLLTKDRQRAPFTYVKGEYPIYTERQILSHGQPLTICLGGSIDRIDQKDGITRIVDYKTGGELKSVQSLDNLFHYDKGRQNYIFQACYYAYLMCDIIKEAQKLAPILLYMKTTADEKETPYIQLNKEPLIDFRMYRQEFEELLDDTINEIFNSDVPYTQAKNEKACTYCKFLSLCGRKPKKSYF